MNRFLKSAAAPLAALLVLLLLPAPRARAQNFLDRLLEGIQQAEQQQNRNNNSNSGGKLNNAPKVHKYEYRPGRDDYNQDNNNSNFRNQNRDYYDDDYDYEPNNAQPQYRQRPVTPQQNAAPEVAEVKLVPAKPNPVQMNVRSATRAEVESVRKELAGLQEELVADLEDALEEALPKTTRLVAQLEAKGVPSETQTLILQAVKSGNADQAQILWTTNMKDAATAEELYRRVALGHALKGLRENAGDLVARDVRSLRRVLDKANLETALKKDAQKTIAELEASLSLLDGVGAGGDGAAKALALPSGPAEVLCNPKLAKGAVVELAPGRFMVSGTGKKLEMRQMNLASALGYAAFEGAPVGATEGREITRGVVIRCLAGAKSPIAYRLVRQVTVYDSEEDENLNQNQSFDYKMAPGEFQHLQQAGWRVDFHRGGEFGQGSYQLKPGTYEFRPTAKGWELFALAQYTVTLDNSLGRQAFHYVMNNEPQLVEAGQTKTHKSAYPPVMRYMRGAQGAEKAVRLDEGAYRVGLFTGDGGWDVFPAQAATAPNVAEGSPFVPAQ